MNVSLTAELETFVQKRVESGRYQTASEVVREALRLLEEKELVKSVRLEKLRADVQAGIDELDRGEGIEAEELFADLEKRQLEFETKVRPA